METGESARREIERLRAALDEVGLRHAEEIARLRADLDALEGGLARPKMPPPVPMREAAVAEPVTKAPAERPPPPPPAGQSPMAEVVAPATAKDSFELELGRVWLVRLGVAVLVTGLVLLGNYAYQNWIREISAAARLGGLLAFSLGLCGVGWKLTARDGLRRYGEVVLGGGLAFFYWCVYAAHHVERLRVIESPVAGAVALLGAAGVIVGVSVKRDSRTTAVLGLLLASYATVLQPLGWISAFSNGLLAAAAVALMRRPGWAAPGVAGLAGTWLSFLWWQLGGAAGGEVTPVAFPFVATSWVIFLLPGLPGLASRFAGSLSERGRAWFAGANNAACFTMLSLIWFALGYDEYWTLPAGFGLVLVALGASGRGRGLSGSTHLVQGLLALSMALVLKLDGYHLAFGLALEALVLAGAFVRFRKLPELVFSALALVSSGVVALVVPGPVWSAGVTALLMTAATAVWRIGADRPGGKDGFQVSKLIGLGIAAATAVAILGWCWELPDAVRAVVAQAMALGLAVTVLRVDRGKWLPELRWSAAAFAATGAVLLAGPGLAEHSEWGIALLAAVAAWLWEKDAKQGAAESGAPGLAPALGWLHGLTSAVALVLGIGGLGLTAEGAGWLHVLAVPMLVIAAARALGCPRLGTALALMLVAGFMGSMDVADRSAALGFGFVVSALATLGFSRKSVARAALAEGLLAVAMRLVALAGWLMAWRQIFPDSWVEVMALSGGALLVARARGGWSVRLPEAWAMLGLSMLVCLGRWAMPVLDLGELPPAAGWGGVVGWFAAAFAGGGTARLPLLWVACATLTGWASRWSVATWGWEAVAICWTALGFALVSAGLWRRVVTLRQAGFLLLTAALVKLFALDVWDYEAFTRVVAFLALGVALVVLGFFYNRFAGLLRRLLE